MNPHISAIMVAGAAILGLAAAHAELYAVGDEAVELYRNQRVATHLPPGQIVEAVPLERNPKWLKVTWGNGAYEADGQGFVSAADIRTSGRLRLASLEQAAAVIAQNLDASLRRRTALADAILAARFDSTVVYQTTQYLTVPVAGRQTLQSTQTIEDKLEPNRARRVIRDWEAELQKLEGTIDKLRQQRLDSVAARRRMERRLEGYERRFQLYQADPANYRKDLYIVVDSPAQLFLDKVHRDTLPVNTVVEAVPHASNPDWILIARKGAVYESRAENFRSRSRLEDEHAVRAVTDTQVLADLEADTRQTLARLERIHAVQLALTVETSQNYFTPSVWPFRPDDLAGIDLYQSLRLPAGAREMVNCNRARKLLKELGKDEAALTQQLNVLRKQDGDTRRAQIRAQALREQLLQKLQPATPAK